MDRSYIKLLKTYYMLFSVSIMADIAETFIQTPALIYTLHSVFISVLLLISAVIFLSHSIKSVPLIIITVITTVINCMNFLTAINAENFL